MKKILLFFLFPLFANSQVIKYTTSNEQIQGFLQIKNVPTSSTLPNVVIWDSLATWTIKKVPATALAGLFPCNCSYNWNDSVNKYSPKDTAFIEQDSILVHRKNGVEINRDTIRIKPQTYFIEHDEMLVSSTINLFFTPQTNSYELYKNGMLQRTPQDYTIVGTTVTLVVAPDLLDLYTSKYYKQ